MGTRDMSYQSDSLGDVLSASDAANPAKSLSSEGVATSESVDINHRGTWMECADLSSLGLPTSSAEAIDRIQTNLFVFRHCYFVYCMVVLCAFLIYVPSHLLLGLIL